MKAQLLDRRKENLRNGAIVEITIWRLPAPTSERPHGLKYSLFYGRPGKRIIGYDNERGKGDHRHYRGREEPYVFVDIATLLDDFQQDIEKELKDG
ncbi:MULTISPECIES: toxin-antitoxin system TumE family protein [Aurantimonas]|uniref:DUF6516 family protein n=1 Tax=Aurantimonas marianensis TaxID=2920428 RepID=A0A9X2H712_9HYPH|nr:MULTISPECIES: DUF6516 family protein [Aurantimonas]MCP3056542.1 DUF6516 family protein [Aurantimonas marianensis]